MRPTLCLALLCALAGCVGGEVIDEEDMMSSGKSDDLAPAETQSYFPTDYEQARERFRALSAEAARLFPDAEVGHRTIPSQTDSDLTIDFVHIPAREAQERLAIFTSGVHGGEAFVGSAMQEMLLREWLPTADLSTTGVLFIHALNPWGYKNRRRVTENNVDLNRNFDIDPMIFKTENEGYQDLNEFLNDDEPVSFFDVNTSITRVFFNALRHGQSKLRQATLGGQYEFPLGIYYGGSDFEPNKLAVEDILIPILEPYKAIFLGDLHTGYGERGHLHLFGATNVGTPAAMDTVFEGFEIDTGENNDDFYETHGDFTVFVGQLLSEDKLYVGTTLEYGTLDSQTTMGSIRSLQRMRLENQGYHHGFDSDGLREGVITRFNEMFYPSETDWRDTIAQTTREMVPVFLERFSAMSLDLPTSSDR